MGHIALHTWDPRLYYGGMFAQRAPGTLLFY